MSRLKNKFLEDNSIDSGKIVNGSVSAEDLFSTNAAGGIPLLDQTGKIVPSQISKIGDYSNNSQFEEDGTIKFNGDATVWDDLRIPLYARSTGGGNPTYASGFGGNASLYYWSFSGSAINSMYFETQMPHSWAGTTIYPHIHWAPTTADTGSVRWIFEYVWVNKDGVFSTSSSYILDYNISSPSQWVHLISNGSGINPTTNQTGLSSLMVGRVYRSGGGVGDTYNASTAIIAIDIHFEMDTVGSRLPLSK